MHLAPFPNKILLRALENVYLTRMSDEKMSKLVRQNKGGTFHMPVTGHEVIGTAAALALTPGKDWGLPYYRDRAFALGLGADLVDLFGVFLGRKTVHHSGGRMMPDHFSQKDLRIPCQSSCVGSQFLQAVGVAFGARIKGDDDVVYVSGGDGSTSQGDFHEALNLACLYRLAVVFVIQDNGWAISVPLSEQVAGESIAARSRGYFGLEVEEVDGSDFDRLFCRDGASCPSRKRSYGPHPHRRKSAAPLSPQQQRRSEKIPERRRAMLCSRKRSRSPSRGISSSSRERSLLKSSLR